MMDESQPFGLNAGTVRGGITIMLIGAMVGMYAWKGTCPPDMVVLASTAFGYYFGTRVGASPPPKP